MNNSILKSMQNMNMNNEDTVKVQVNSKTKKTLTKQQVLNLVSNTCQVQTNIIRYKLMLIVKLVSFKLRGEDQD